MLQSLWGNPLLTEGAVNSKAPRKDRDISSALVQLTNSTFQALLYIQMKLLAECNS